MLLVFAATGVVPRHGVEAAGADPGRTDWISDPRATPAGHETSYFARGLSDDGRFALFESPGSYFVANLEDANGGSDVFRRDMTTGHVSAVSTSTSSASRTGDRPSGESTMGGDGRFVAFSSDSSDLDPSVSDTRNQDVFLKDMEEGWTRLVSRAHTGDQAGDSSSGRPQISRDGRYVVFESQARDLVPEAGPGTPKQLYRYDRLARVVELVSADATGRPANRDVKGASMSGDGRFVSFSTWATNLVSGGETAESEDVFRRDMSTGTIELVSRSANGAPIGGSHEGVISGDGSTVAFVASDATALTGTADANGVADDVFVWDASTGGVELVSAAGTGASTANGVSGRPSISADGQTIAFLSRATDLVSGVRDANNLPSGSWADGYPQEDVFVRLRRSSMTTLVTRSALDADRTGDRGSTKVVVSADGSTVTFESDASDLVAGVEDRSRNIYTDVFSYRLSSAEMRVVSLDDSAPSATLPGASFSPIPTPDGSFIAFDHRYRANHPSADYSPWFLAARRAMGPSLPPPPPPPNGATPPDFSNPPGTTDTGPTSSTIATATTTTVAPTTTTTSLAPKARPTCFGRPATLIGTPGDDQLTPTGEAPIVIVGLGGNDVYTQPLGGAKETYFCGGPGKDTVNGAVTRFDGGSGKDTLHTWKCARPHKLKSVERKHIRSGCPAAS